MYPPKLKTRSRAVDTPNPYLTEERKEKLLVMKRQLESQDAKLKIKQLYANAREIVHQIDCSESPEATVHGSLKKMDTTELVQEYKDIDEAKKQKDKEDRRLIRRTLREIERQKQKDLREKLEYRETVRRITAVSQQEQQKAQMREEEEKKEDLRFLKESLRLEKESEARRLAERQRHVEAHQSRADRIAPTTRVDKAAEDNTEYLKRQVQERQDRKKAEAEERRKIQQEQEEDAKAYKIETEAKERNKRLENMKQQNLLLQQIEEHKRRTDMSVSPTEIKLNRALLEQVKEFKSNHLSRALPRRCQKDDSDSDDN
ncbi:hypothetical protein TGRH88_040960 [Toxoplasma gondii]|uniref:Uncharacterized protein n=1 Tax=Toxoplasma gondii TaxID=5811 RepID=A0A7J6K1D4_TOXGO|nr:hypothetical protein TGRH88_040960 [Toxoplasma gondii]